MKLHTNLLLMVVLAIVILPSACTVGSPEPEYVVVTAPGPHQGIDIYPRLGVVAGTMTDMIGLSPYYYSEGAPRVVISLLTQERTGPVDDCRDCMSWEGFVDGLQFRFAEGGTLEIRYDPAKWSETPLPPSVQA